jgi:hypothetical protein
VKKATATLQRRRHYYHLLFGFVSTKKATIAFAFFLFFVPTKKAMVAYVVAFFFVLENFYGSIVVKKKKTTISITFFDGFVTKKWRWELPSPFMVVLL